MWISRATKLHLATKICFNLQNAVGRELSMSLTHAFHTQCLTSSAHIHGPIRIKLWSCQFIVYHSSPTLILGGVTPIWWYSNILGILRFLVFKHPNTFESKLEKRFLKSAPIFAWQFGRIPKQTPTRDARFTVSLCSDEQLSMWFAFYVEIFHIGLQDSRPLRFALNSQIFPWEISVIVRKIPVEYNLSWKWCVLTGLFWTTGLQI